MHEREYLIARRFTALGAYLQELRMKKRLTQREVSLRLGYSSAQFISNFERGISMPPLKKLKELKVIYGASRIRLVGLALEGKGLILAEALMPKRKHARPKVSSPDVGIRLGRPARRPEMGGNLIASESRL